ncbi:hypothetical protein FRC09_013225 [Ceratobasidium sp. 395]|nr:hypothetical protein FRC09_013225 [Ceratobasidium sp. 395]
MTHLDEIRSDPVPTNQISQHLPENMRLERGLYLKGPGSGTSVVRENPSMSHRGLASR